jgi:hypothetical protein
MNSTQIAMSIDNQAYDNQHGLVWDIILNSTTLSNLKLKLTLHSPTFSTFDKQQTCTHLHV